MRARQPAVAGLLGLAVLLSLAPGAKAAEEVVQPVAVVDSKAVYGRIESRFVVPARSRIGGVLVDLDVTEGSVVEAGRPIARVADEKLVLQMNAADARIRAAASQLDNARVEFDRTAALLARGAATQQRLDQLRMQVDVVTNQMNQAEAEKAVILQQATEGTVVAPAAGRVLTVPIRRGSVVLAGEQVATIAGGGLFLRLAIPERHAPLLTVGAVVEIGEGAAQAGRPSRGKIEKVYPQIESGRVIADVAVEGLSDRFVGERVLVRVPVATRQVLAVPEAALTLRAGIDFVRIATSQGERDVAVVIGALVETPTGTRREILTGLRPGDRVILP
ncbi:efflux RND transporter periplasmic adaptor subunit [Phreatobacter cathodiphilus]|uniref:Efflux transporter periplasmic adaptor subunit n=1 Tax=Phreatobacter cathodiphilus TaxID=1868589 RepID=A0A2S0NAX8_9HYPH|nr:efflux RND transporter periplasmic adaptor subunit [Phreatobacter cathodiphilus]AVO45093.1 efflux transporter periplasmic adaptor subunit [Phreatobacter cathodiphilus]